MTGRAVTGPSTLISRSVKPALTAVHLPPLPLWVEEVLGPIEGTGSWVAFGCAIVNSGQATGTALFFSSLHVGSHGSSSVPAVTTQKFCLLAFSRL